MAHKKGGGSSRNGRDSNAKYRGVKVHDGETIKAGGIIIRQVGGTIAAGHKVGTGKDYTLYALADGKVKFSWKTRKKKQVSVVPAS
ncbi:MAG TPA: 50S ribosomal protein L27 [Polyangiaceae bacterium]|nr:50S ribosomal protein L27 [Polyangiaceae bacterium]